MVSSNPQQRDIADSLKLFVVSLPRTATTSFCLAMLEQGFKVAHTAYTLDAFAQANVIADTPAFNDYIALDAIYPDAKFVYIERDPQQWLPSIRQLLARMQRNLHRTDGGFNPILKRCYGQVFGQFSDEQLQSDQYLLDCFFRHQQPLFEHFANRQQDFIRLDINDTHWWQHIGQLLNQPMYKASFPHANIGAKVTHWSQLKHPLKIDSTRNGRCDNLDKILSR